MYCKKCGNELSDIEQFCSKCGKKVKAKQEDKIKNKKLPIIVIITGLVIVIAIIVYFTCFNKSIETSLKPEGIKQIGTKGSQVSQLSELSFTNMKSNNEKLNLDETKKEILNYFDNDYFKNETDYVYEDLQRYPTVFENSKITMCFEVIKVLKSTADEFEALISCEGYEFPGLHLDTINNDIITINDVENGTITDILVLKSKQLKERLIEGDIKTLYGRYIGVETYEINGKSYSIPTIDTTKIADISGRFNLDTINTVAKCIFGNDIKIREALNGYQSENPDTRWADIDFYVVTLDNQSNANFKCFNFCKDFGFIEYNVKGEEALSTTQKTLFISADFQHYIVSTYDTGTKHLYIDYFNKDLTKLWSREFDYKENMQYYSIPMDYTSSKLAFVINNDLYLIDLNTGKNIIEPVLVGNKERVVMLSDYILLIGNNNKDAIMTVDYNGNILKKLDADITLEKIDGVGIQIVNGKVVIHLNTSSNSDSNYKKGTKYIVLNDDGTIEFSTQERIN